MRFIVSLAAVLTPLSVGAFASSQLREQQLFRLLRPIGRLRPDHLLIRPVWHFRDLRDV
jgi:hypothetical protein